MTTAQLEEMSAVDLLRWFACLVAQESQKLQALETRLMDVHTAAKYLDLTESALRQKAGVTIPCIRTDGKLRFDRLELDRWIDRAPRAGV